MLWEDRAWDDYLYWQAQDNIKENKYAHKGYSEKHLRRHREAGTTKGKFKWYVEQAN